MLCAEEADTLSAKLTSQFGILGCFAVGANTHGAELVCHGHERLEPGVLGGVYHVQHTLVNITLSTVESDEVALFVGFAANLHDFGSHVDFDFASAYDTAFTPTPGNQCCVAGHTAAGGKNTHGGTHTFNIFRISFFADKDNVLAGFVYLNSLVSRKHNVTPGTARTCGQAFSNGFGLLFSSLVYNGMEELVELSGLKTHNGCGLIDEPFFKHVHGHVESGCACAFASTRLQKIKFAFLNGKLQILHVVIVPLQLVLDSVELFVDSGHGCFQRLHVRVLLGFGGLVNRVGCTGACNYILALGIDQPLAEKFVLTSGGVTCKSNTGGGSIAHVTKNHGLNINRCAPIVGYTLYAAVGNSAFAIPAFEYSGNTAPKLFVSVVREIFTQDLFDTYFVLVADYFEIVSG